MGRRQRRHVRRIRTKRGRIKKIINPNNLKFKPPKAAQRNAKRVLVWKKKHKVKAMTPTGWARARQLASGDEVSFDVVKRMARFKRHRKNAEVPKGKKPWQDRGRVAWDGWGGDEGVAWAESTVKKFK